MSFKIKEIEKPRVYGNSQISNKFAELREKIANGEITTPEQVIVFMNSEGKSSAVDRQKTSELQNELTKLKLELAEWKHKYGILTEEKHKTEIILEITMERLQEEQAINKKYRRSVIGTSP